MSNPSAAGDSLLRVSGLRVEHFAREGGHGQPLVHGVDLRLDRGRSLALVGPSGCGKSLLALSLLGLLPPALSWQGRIAWQGTLLTDPVGTRWRSVRGRGMGLILQEPMSSLNPVLRAGDQIAETLRVHRGLGRRQARSAAVELLAETCVPEPEQAARLYPHQLSGGMRQRVLLAATLACDPDLLIADEPTTALDVLVQKEILALINRIRRQRNMALLFITHDLNLVPLLADEVAFMSAGRIEKVAPAVSVEVPAAPTSVAVAPATEAPVLSAHKVQVWYEGAPRAAVAGVDLDLRPGRAVGLLGESGCGKTSLGRALARHVPLHAGTMILDGKDNPAADMRAVRSQRRRVQMLFQDPGGSLDPRQRVGDALREAAGKLPVVPEDLLAEVGLEPDLATRYPHQLSGGQRQRVALARCLATSPSVLIADEPTSALDGEARDVVLALLERIMRQRGLALLLISHDLEVLRGMCHEVHVMFAGLVVEVLPGGISFCPQHPYTLDLLGALPRTLREEPWLWAEESFTPQGKGGPFGHGCPRQGSCRLQKPRCGKGLPPLKRLSSCHWLRCPEAEATDPSQFIDTL